MERAVPFILCFVAACWVLVIGHQTGWPVDLSRYSSVAGSLYIAYTVATLSVIVGGTASLMLLKKRERGSGSRGID